VNAIEIATIDQRELDSVTGGTFMPRPTDTPRAKLFKWALRQGKAVYDWATGSSDQPQ
jgi:hypothetical protein